MGRNNDVITEDLGKRVQTARPCVDRFETAKRLIGAKCTVAQGCLLGLFLRNARERQSSNTLKVPFNIMVKGLFRRNAAMGCYRLALLRLAMPFTELRKISMSFAVFVMLAPALNKDSTN